MIILALGANLAALCIPLYSLNTTAATLLSILAYVLIGLGVGASGTSLLALLATHTAQRRRCRCNNYLANDDFWNCSNSHYCWKVA